MYPGKGDLARPILESIPAYSRRLDLQQSQFNNLIQIVHTHIVSHIHRTMNHAGFIVFAIRVIHIHFAMIHLGHVASGHIHAGHLRSLRNWLPLMAAKFRPRVGKARLYSVILTF